MHGLLRRDVMRVLVVSIVVAMGGESARAGELDTPETVAFAQEYLSAYLGAEAELAGFLADEVLLLPSHELLKAEYGLNSDGDRSTSLRVSRDDYLSAVEILRERMRRERKSGAIDVSSFDYQVVVAETETTPISPPSRSGESFPIPTEPGDRVVVVRPEIDLLLLVVRMVEGKPRIVTELLD